VARGGELHEQIAVTGQRIVQEIGARGREAHEGFVSAGDGLVTLLQRRVGDVREQVEGAAREAAEAIGARGDELATRLETTGQRLESWTAADRRCRATWSRSATASPG
jgi:hypothetical protein